MCVRLFDERKSTLPDCKLHEGRGCTYFSFIILSLLLRNFWHILRPDKYKLCQLHARTTTNSTVGRIRWPKKGLKFEGTEEAS